MKKNNKTDLSKIPIPKILSVMPEDDHPFIDSRESAGGAFISIEHFAAIKKQVPSQIADKNSEESLNDAIWLKSENFAIIEASFNEYQPAAVPVTENKNVSPATKDMSISAGVNVAAEVNVPAGAKALTVEQKQLIKSAYDATQQDHKKKADEKEVPDYLSDTNPANVWADKQLKRQSKP